jgi:hypothetical protein
MNTFNDTLMGLIARASRLHGLYILKICQASFKPVPLRVLCIGLWNLINQIFFDAL